MTQNPNNCNQFNDTVKLKAKIQIMIGLSTVAVSMAGVIVQFSRIIELVYRSGLMLEPFYLEYLLGLILPVSYCLTIIKKQPKITRTIIRLWCMVSMACPFSFFFGLA